MSAIRTEGRFFVVFAIKNNCSVIARHEPRRGARRIGSFPLETCQMFFIDHQLLLKNLEINFIFYNKLSSFVTRFKRTTIVIVCTPSILSRILYFLFDSSLRLKLGRGFCGKIAFKRWTVVFFSGPKSSERFSLLRHIRGVAVVLKSQRCLTVSVFTFCSLLKWRRFVRLKPTYVSNEPSLFVTGPFGAETEINRPDQLSCECFRDSFAVHKTVYTPRHLRAWQF